MVVSLEVLGNPIGLFRHFSTGCIDACNEPYQGAMLSVGDMFAGVAMGTGSCIRNTVFGIFNSLAKFSGATAQVCVVCSSADQKRRRQGLGLRQPQHICQGLSFGIESLSQGVADGIVGLATGPVRGSRRGGVLGCLQGSVHGMAGCVLLPAIGCLDMIRQTSEGLRNTAISSAERQQSRTLPPRPLYGFERAARPYCLEDANLKALLVSLDASLCNAALVRYQWDPAGTVVVVTDTLIIQAHRGRRRILVQVPLQDVVQVAPDSDRMVVSLRARACDTALPELQLRVSNETSLAHTAAVVAEGLAALSA